MVECLERVDERETAYFHTVCSDPSVQSIESVAVSMLTSGRDVGFLVFCNKNAPIGWEKPYWREPISPRATRFVSECIAVGRLRRTR